MIIACHINILEDYMAASLTFTVFAKYIQTPLIHLYRVFLKGSRVVHQCAMFLLKWLKKCFDISS